MKIMANTAIDVHIHSDNKKMKHHGFLAAQTLMLQTWCQGINTLHFLLLLNIRLRPANSPVHCESGPDGRGTTILRQFQTTRDRDQNKSEFAYINNASAGYSRAVAVH